MNERVRYQLSVSVFVMLIRDGEICMLRRCGTGWMDGSFSIPAGGLDAGETLAAAAIREANEEVGVQISPENLHYAHTLHSKTEGRTWLGHFFQATEWEGIPTLCEPEKHSDLQWCPITVLPAETIPYVRQAIQCVIAQNLYSEYGWD
ncbi:NUDIX hydrolase [Pseudomonas sp. SDO5522_S412]